MKTKLLSVSNITNTILLCFLLMSNYPYYPPYIPCHAWPAPPATAFPGFDPNQYYQGMWSVCLYYYVCIRVVSNISIKCPVLFVNVILTMFPPLTGIDPWYMFPPARGRHPTWPSSFDNQQLATSPSSDSTSSSVDSTEQGQ